MQSLVFVAGIRRFVVGSDRSFFVRECPVNEDPDLVDYDATILLMEDVVLHSLEDAHALYG